MLWDLIRDFFVSHIFGGTNSLGQSSTNILGYLWQVFNGSVDDEALSTINEVSFKIGNNAYGADIYMSLGDWLSSTATIITISIIFVLCCLFVYKIIKLIGGLIR